MNNKSVRRLRRFLQIKAVKKSIRRLRRLPQIKIIIRDKLSGLEHSQIINYLKATVLKIGFLINFSSKSIEHKRIVYFM
jgi:hypothetical protein